MSIFSGVTRNIRNSRRFVEQIPNVENFRRDPLGIAEFGNQLLRFFGVRKSNAERTVSALTQRVDNAVANIRAFSELRSQTITNAAKSLKVDLDDFTISNRIYAALDATPDLRSTSIAAMTVNERIVYGMIRRFQQTREKWIMETVSELLSRVTPNAKAQQSYEQIFRDKFFQDDYFVRIWKDPVDSTKTVQRATERDEIVRSASPASARGRVLSGTYEELVKQGYTPKYVNPVEALSESTIEIQEALFQASFLRELLELGVIRKRPPGVGAQPAFASLDNQIALANRLPTQRPGLPNGDTFIRGNIKFNNGILNALRDILPDESGVGRLVVGDEYYVTRYANQLLSDIFNVNPSGFLTGTARLARQLKLIKLGLSSVPVHRYYLPSGASNLF